MVAGSNDFLSDLDSPRICDRTFCPSGPGPADYKRRRTWLAYPWGNADCVGDRRSKEQGRQKVMDLIQEILDSISAIHFIPKTEATPEQIVALAMELKDIPLRLVSNAIEFNNSLVFVVFEEGTDYSTKKSIETPMVLENVVNRFLEQNLNSKQDTIDP